MRWYTLFYFKAYFFDVRSLTGKMTSTTAAMTQEQLLGLFPHFQLPSYNSQSRKRLEDQLVTDQTTDLNFLHSLRKSNRDKN